MAYPISRTDRRRHGHSRANEADVIISTVEAGCLPEWGLTDLGRQQADAAGEALLAALGVFDPERFLVFTSPFSRATETALQAASHLEVGFKDPRWQRAAELRERFFGAHEGKGTGHYEDVWAEDGRDVGTAPRGGGESVADVAARLRGFIEGLEARYEGHNILLVSHGDALSVLAAVLLGTDLRQHRDHGLGNCGLLRVPLAQGNGAAEPL